MFIIIVFWLGGDMLWDFVFFSCSRCTSFYIHASLLTFFVCLSYFIPVAPMRERGKTLVYGFPFPISILNGMCLPFSNSATTSAQCVFGAKNRNTLALVNLYLYTKLTLACASCTVHSNEVNAGSFLVF